MRVTIFVLVMVVCETLCAKDLTAELLKAVRGKKHPYLFGNIKKAPGWKRAGKKPFADFWGVVEQAAKAKKAECYFLRGPVTGAVVHAGGRAHEAEVMFNPAVLGLMWLRTGKKEFLEAARKELAKIQPRRGRDNRTGECEVLARFLLRYSLLFDFVAQRLRKKERRATVEALCGYARTCADEFLRSRNSHRRLMLGAALGVAALALANEKGVPKDELKSWLRLATVGLFEDDPYKWPEGLKPALPRGSIGGPCNYGGYCRIGGYRSYWTGLLSKWLLVYHLATGRNPFKDYPTSRALLEPLWLAMPTRHSPQQNTRLGGFEHDFFILWKLMSQQERSALRWYMQQDPAIPDRPRFTYGDVWNSIFWALYYPHKLPKEKMNWCSFFDPKAEVCIFRQNWDKDALWLSFYAFSYPIGSHRDMCHNDNMSFEICALGDYLVCDPGEVKGRMRGYGPVMGHGHNILLIDGLAPVKEDITEQYYRFVDAARFCGHIIAPCFEAVSARMKITHTEYRAEKVVVEEKGRELNAKKLEKPLTWQRAVLFPSREYFVIVDRVKAVKKHHLTFLLHLSSLNYEPTRGANAGHVLGELRLCNKKVDWLKGDQLNASRQWLWLWSQKSTPLEALWQTVSIYRKKVYLHIISVPEGEVKVGRMWGHIPQTRFAKGESAEVDHPLVGITNHTKELWRITVLFPSRKKTAPRYKIKKCAGGLLLTLEFGGHKDLIFAGSAGEGGVAFNGFAGFLRLVGKKPALLGGIGCRRLVFGGETLISASRPVDVACKVGQKGYIAVTAQKNVALKTPLSDKKGVLVSLPPSTHLVMSGEWKPEKKKVASLRQLRIPAGKWLASANGVVGSFSR